MASTPQPGDSGVIHAFASTAMLLGWIYFFLIRARRQAAQVQPEGRLLGELMEAADRLERVRAEHPVRFRLRGWWLALRAHLDLAATLQLGFGILLAVAGLRLALTALLATPVGPMAALLACLAPGLACLWLWLLGSGRYKPRAAGVVLFGLGTYLPLVVASANAVGNRQDADSAFTGVSLLAMGTVLLGNLARRIPGMLGLDQGVTGKSLDIHAGSSPRLHQLVRETAESLGLPMPRRVLVAEQTSMANLGLAYAPGGRVSELRMGIDDLELLSIAELRAVIAHELEHQRHGGPLGRLLISGILKLREQPPGRLAVLTPASRVRLAEEMELMVCAMLRDNERSSDRASARVDAATAARALTRLVVRGHKMELIFSQPERLVIHASEPPATSESLDALIEAQPWSADLERRCRAAALLNLTLPGHTHPSLSDRLRGLGQPAPTDIGRGAEPTATSLLDATGLDFVRRHHETWRVKNRDSWMQMHARLKADEALLHDPENARLEGLSDTQLRKRATDLWLLRGSSEALPALQAYLTRVPDDEWAVHWTARVKAETGSAEGVRELVDHARRDPRQTDSLREAAIHTALVGDEAEARRLWRRTLELHDLAQRDKRERDTLTDAVEVDPPDLPKPERELLEGTLLDHGVVQRAYLVRRRLTHITRPDQHLIILQFWIGEDGRYEPSHAEHRKTASDAVLKLFNGTKHAIWVLPSDGFPLYTAASSRLPAARIK